MRSAIRRLSLTQFRSYDRAEFQLDGRPVVLVGPNGAGKTNLLEAVSLLTPGRGLRGAALAEFSRRLAGELRGRPWAVAATVSLDGEETRLGTGVETDRASRRLVRLEGETAPASCLAGFQRQVWLTPAQDRLFLEGASDRRRFFDRLVFAGLPEHAGRATAYEKAQRERMRLLVEGPADPAWLDLLEARLSQAGARLAEGRAGALAALQAEIDQRAERPFPQALLSLTGEWETMAGEGVGFEEMADRLARALRDGRSRDAAAGRALVGPHRTDLAVVHAERGRPAAECSTGEQKALILNLVLAQAARLSRTESAPNPVLLLDEVAAHLDRRRRAALFDEIVALRLQAFMTGTDEHLFEDLQGRAQAIRMDPSGPAISDES